MSEVLFWEKLNEMRSAHAVAEKNINIAVVKSQAENKRLSLCLRKLYKFKRI